MEPLLVFAYSALFIFLVHKSRFFRMPAIPLSWMQLAFLAKVLAGCVLGWLYFDYYQDEHTSDTIKFFNDSNILFNVLRKEPIHFLQMFTGIGGNDPALRPYYESMSTWLNTDVLFNDNKTIVRLNTLFRFFSLGHYYVHVVLMNMISFTGMFCLYKVLSRNAPSRSRLMFILLFALPSLLFWGSGVLKDSLLLFALGTLVHSFDSLVRGERRLSYKLIFCASLFLLLFTKFYVILTVLPGLAAWIFTRHASGWKTAKLFFVMYTGFITVGFNLYRLDDKYDLSDLIYYKQRNFFVQSDIMSPGSRIEIPTIAPSAMSILINAPSAFARTLFRPGPMDFSGNILVRLAAVENTIFLVALVLLLLFFGKRQATHFESIHFFCLSCVLIILTLIGLITPVLGAMVRYKVVVFPFLIFLVVSFIDPQRLGQRFRFLADTRDTVRS